jgi:hypothetical protein
VGATEYPHPVQDGITEAGIEGSVPERILLDRIQEAIQHGGDGRETNSRG